MVAPRWRLGHEPTTARGQLEVQTAMSDNVIEVQNLTKRYGQTTVVKGISFSVRPGEIFGLLGPNGSGKTTTILMLLGLTEISEGYVRLLGRDPAREPLAVKRRVGYLPDWWASMTTSAPLAICATRRNSTGLRRPSAKFGSKLRSRRPDLRTLPTNT